MLKVDCEGCEWDAFHHLATQPSSLLRRVDAIYVELHLALQMATDADLVKWASMYDLLFAREGFKLWWMHENRARAAGGAPVHPALRQLAIRTYGDARRQWVKVADAFELGLVRPGLVSSSQHPSSARCRR